MKRFYNFAVGVCINYCSCYIVYSNIGLYVIALNNVNRVRLSDAAKTEYLVTTPCDDLLDAIILPCPSFSR